MKESRRIRIQDKRVRLADIQAIASIFLEQATSSRNKDGSPSVSFEVIRVDGTRFEAEEISLFSEPDATQVRPPKVIEMTFSDYKLNRRMSLTVTHGGSYSDDFSISSEDSEWLRATYLRMQERFSSLESTENFFTRHPDFTALIGTMGLGCIANWILQGVVYIFLLTWIKDWQPSSDLLNQLRSIKGPLLFFDWLTQMHLWVWFNYYLIGGLPWMYFKPWFYSAFPSNDLQLGPDHLRSDEIRRRRIVQFAAFVVLPLVLSGAYDFIKTSRTSMNRVSVAEDIKNDKSLIKSDLGKTDALKQRRPSN